MPGRKSLVELLRAFKRAFAERSDVVLKLRTNRSRAVCDCFHAAGVSLDDPQFDIDTRTRLSTEEFAGFYSEVHCTVHPSRAEGFGLIPFQSIACETPVIAPADTGMADYLNSANAVTVRMVDIHRAPDVYYRTGSQPVVDEDHLVEQMLYMEANWEAEYEKVRRIARKFRERHRWGVALSEFLALVGKLDAAPNTETRSEIILRHFRSYEDSPIRP